MTVRDSRNRGIISVEPRQRKVLCMATNKSEPAQSAKVEEVDVQWYRNALHRLERFARFTREDVEPDWPLPTKIALSQARGFLERLNFHGMRPVNLSTSVRGGVAFTFLGNKYEVFVEFLNDGDAYGAVMDEEDLDTEPQTFPVELTKSGFDALVEVISNAVNA
ncbi:MAG: hypothetical protein KJ052_03885 [Candidatus Hydrogenedentes bacterium]|nr:hypothetical protein [Candidatus Hydrogenedentota bacterium]